MSIVKYKKIFFGITILLVALSVFSISYFGLNLGIDFKGGSLMEFSYTDTAPDKEILNAVIGSLEIGNFSLRDTGNNGFILRTADITQTDHENILNALSLDGGFNVNENRFTLIGPTIGSELRSKAVIAIIVVLFAIILFIAFAFRKVSKPVSSWRYGLVAIIALIHDILIPAGAYALYGYFTLAEVDTLFVMALLAILGYSINDTIVVFDRVRENLRANQENHIKEEFEETVGKSLSETYVRSINTSLTTLFVLVSLLLFGGGSITSFVFILVIGVIAGTYSSIFLAAPLLVLLKGKR